MLAGRPLVCRERDLGGGQLHQLHLQGEAGTCAQCAGSVGGQEPQGWAGGDRCSDGALCMGVRSSWAEQGRGCSGLDLIPPRSLEDQQECSLSRITEMAVHPPCWMGHGVCQPQPRAPDVGQPLRWFLLSSLGAFLAQLGTKKPRAQGTLEPCSVPL